MDGWKRRRKDYLFDRGHDQQTLPQIFAQGRLRQHFESFAWTMIRNEHEAVCLTCLTLRVFAMHCFTMELYYCLRTGYLSVSQTNEKGSSWVTYHINEHPTHVILVFPCFLCIRATKPILSYVGWRCEASASQSKPEETV